MFGSILGSLAGFGTSVANDFSSGLINNYFSRDLMSTQNSYNNYAYKHRYQWQVEDMRKAGLNPILSAGAAGSPASVGIANANASSSASTAKQLDNVVQSVQGLVKAQRDKTEAESRSANADAQAKEIQNMMMFDRGSDFSGAQDVKDFNKGNVQVEKQGDGIPLIDVKVNPSSPPPLWKVLAEAKRDLSRLDVSDKDMNIALKAVKFDYNSQLQNYREKYPILPALEVFGSSARQVSGVIKDLKLTPVDLVKGYQELKRLGFDFKKLGKKKEFKFLREFKK